jgi:hypothetical protein
MDYRQLLIKYICHVGASESMFWATSMDISPAGMGNLEFNDEEKRCLLDDIFPLARKRFEETDSQS